MSTEAERTIRDREPRTATSTFRQFLSSENLRLTQPMNIQLSEILAENTEHSATSFTEHWFSRSVLLYVHRDHKDY